LSMLSFFAYALSCLSVIWSLVCFEENNINGPVWRCVAALYLTQLFLSHDYIRRIVSIPLERCFGTDVGSATTAILAIVVGIVASSMSIDRHFNLGGLANLILLITWGWFSFIIRVKSAAENGRCTKTCNEIKDIFCHGWKQLDSKQTACVV
jgi:hypothetical protein